MKAPGSLPFKIKRSKRLGNALIRGELYYKADLSTFQNVCKKNKNISDFMSVCPTIINPGLINVKSAKLEDVNKLLQKHFENDWKTLPSPEYYTNILTTEYLDENEEDREDELSSEPLEELPLLVV